VLLSGHWQKSLSHREAVDDYFMLRSKYSLRDNILNTFLSFFTLVKYKCKYELLSLTFFIVVGILHSLHNSTAYLHRAGSQYVFVCVFLNLSKYNGRSNGFELQGLAGVVCSHTHMH